MDTIVDKLLLSKTDNNNILLNIQTIIEKVFINAAMRVAKNNVSKSAKLLGMNGNTLSKKLKELKNKKT
jgi:DNA-binding protein Fis